ncbi:MMPL family transporter [Streptomyces sp. TR06-5]|uniref:MMPL family transporter n=1 Tax=Streptomyces sp. TR06-5 TaxID=3385976 RepID=UPI00399FB2A9
MNGTGAPHDPTGTGSARPRLWHFSLHRPRRTLAAAALLCAVFACLTPGLFDRLASGGFTATGTPSEHAAAVADRYGAGRADLLLVLRPEPGRLDEPEVAGAGQRFAARLAREPGVDRVRSAWDGASPGLRSGDGRRALVLVDLAGDESDTARTAQRLVPEYSGRQGPFAVRAAGPAWALAQATRQAQHDLLRAELLAGPVVLAVIAIALRSLVAALLPVLLGGFAVLGAFAVLRALSAVTEVSVFATNLVGALGFGLAVDYALFVVARFREEHRPGVTARAAAAASLRTAGHTVAVSACLVCCALAVLFLFPFPFLTSMAWAGIVVVVLAALAATLLLPAWLVLLGDRVGRFDPLARVPWAPRPTVGGDSPLWRRIAREVTRRPVRYGGACAVLLVLMVAPFTSAHLGLADENVLPPHAEARTTAHLVQREFGFDPQRTLAVVLPRASAGDGPRAADGARAVTGAGPGGGGALDAYARRAGALPGVAAVRQGGSGPRGGGAVLLVTPSAAPQSGPAGDLVRDLRALPSPGPAYVSGWPAQVLDAREALASRLPWALLLVALGTAGVVHAFTRSVLVPLKVVAVGALSLTAVFGALVFVFQEGHLTWLVGGVTATGTLDMTIPLLLFCVAFGLSVDYELFLVSRVQEAYRRTGDNTGAVVRGIARTGRLFTAAALAVAVAMAALATSRVLLLKELGFGLALAVLVDATLVRGVLVPAVMRLAGHANWWAPGRKPGRAGPAGDGGGPPRGGTAAAGAGSVAGADGETSGDLAQAARKSSAAF